jgi:hypothetical protein
MSANPEAFEFLRKAAYGFVQKHGKDGRKLQEHCVSELDEWRNGDGSRSGLTDIEAEQIIGDVTQWTINNYNPPRRKAERSREERAASEILAPHALELAAETFGAGTVRNAARISGQAKTTVARHLRQQGIAPKRQKKIDALPPKVKWLVGILDTTFPRDGAGLVMMDQLAAAVWDKVVEPRSQTARSTLSTRRKKLAEYLTTVNGVGIGFHLVAAGDVVAVRRGRKFKGFKDTAIWIEDERALRGVRGIALPSEQPSSMLFWADPWLRDVLAILEIGHWPYFTDPKELEPLLRLTRPLFDPRPLYHLFNLAIRRSQKDDFVEDLSALAARVRDTGIRTAAYKVVGDVRHLSARRDWGPHPIDAFDDADLRLKFMERIREVAPDSYARLGYFRAVILEKLSDEFAEELHRIPLVLKRCERLGELEREGGWTPPSAAELSRFHPDNEPPF